MNKACKNLVVALVAALPMANVMAQDSVSATVGLKMWATDWSTWSTGRSLSGAANVRDWESGNTNGWIPSVSVRYKDFMVGGSYFAKKSYDFVAASDPRADVRGVKREEYDVSLGYYVLPTLAILAGYKEVDQWFGGDKYKYSGPIIGASASAPLTSGFSLYGTAAFGLGNMKLKAAGSQDRDVTYRLGEVGVAYSFNVGGGALKSVIGTLGYRSQSLITKFSGDAWSGLKGRDTTEGVTVGLVAAF